MASALALAGGAILVQPASGAATYRACVKKSTGEMRMMTKGMTKCKKGWKKLTWTKSGPAGNPGATGGQGSTGGSAYLGVVVDGNGTVIGKSLGGAPVAPPLILFPVLIDGGAYSYLADGHLYPVGSPLYTDAACATAPFLPADDLEELSLFGGSTLNRFVYRPTATDWGPARAFKATGATGVVINAPTYGFSSAGVCELDDPLYTGYRLELTEIAAPADRPAPLRIL